jgi:hypothetical protein
VEIAAQAATPMRRSAVNVAADESDVIRAGRAIYCTILSSYELMVHTRCIRFAQPEYRLVTFV